MWLKCVWLNGGGGGVSGVGVSVRVHFDSEDRSCHLPPLLFYRPPSGGTG
jgi:hypothetical protein